MVNALYSLTSMPYAIVLKLLFNESQGQCVNSAMKLFWKVLLVSYDKVNIFCKFLVLWMSAVQIFHHVYFPFKPLSNPLYLSPCYLRLYITIFRLFLTFACSFSEPLVDMATLEGGLPPPLQRASAEEFIHIFVNNSPKLSEFLEHMIKVCAIYNDCYFLLLFDSSWKSKENVA